MHKNLILTMAMAALLFTGCRPKQNINQESGLDITNMDPTVHPADDFFRFVNGGWIDKVEMPADRGRWGSFDVLRKTTSENVLQVLEEAAKNGRYDKNSDQGKASVFFQTAMDTVYLNELGLKPLARELERIEQIDGMKDLQDYLVESSPVQNSYFFGFAVMPDLNNSNYYALFMEPGTLGLPERDYYIKDDAHSLAIQTAYKDHIARIFGFLGIDSREAAAKAGQVFDLEKKLAREQLTKEEKRDPLLMNNPVPVSSLDELSPVLDWTSFLKGIGASHTDTVIVTELNYFKQLRQVMNEQNLPQIKEYLKWTLLNESATYLSTELDRASFDFYGKILEGAPEMRERWERTLDQANRSIGEAIGKLYTDKRFPPEAKASAEEMVGNILAAFGERIKKLDWMSDSTKEKALEKLASFKVKIGYPDKWKDYSKLVIKGSEEGGSYLENMINVSVWNWREDVAKIGQPVDKSEWFMAPQVVNAYYSPMYNEIVFPAAILQPPFYNYQADPAVNYGGIGAVIGHEISHGFDDQGSRYDANGNLKNWWTDEDRKRFEERSKLLVKQYDAYEPLDGLHVNGTFTLGENIGDLGGVNVAFDGLKRHISQNGDPGLIDGFTQEQRFFISWGVIWRTKYRDEALRNQIATDPHSPGMIRAVGPLVNVDAFYDAFNISEGSRLFKSASERVKIW